MKTATFKALKPLVLDSQMSCLAGSGAFAASGGFDGAIRLFGLEDQSLKETGKGTGLVGWVTSLAFGKGGLLAGTDSQGNAAAWRDGKPAWSRPALSGAWLRKVAGAPDGQMVAVVGRDGMLRVLAADSGATRVERKLGDDLMSLAWSHDGKRLAVGNLHGAVSIVSAGGSTEKSFELPGFFKVDRMQEVGGIRFLRWSPDNSMLMAGGAEPRTGGFVQAIPKVVCADPQGKVRHDLKLGGDNEGYALDADWHDEGWIAVVTSGQPGTGKLHQLDPVAGKALGTLALVNPHGIFLAGKNLAVALATNANSSGNGRVKDEKGGYRANHSVLQAISIAS